MGIQIGTQLTAPAGYKELEAGVKYYFLWSDSGRERVHLIRLVTRPPKKRKRYKCNDKFRLETPVHLAVLVAQRRALFELGIDSGAIVPCEKQSTLPPWLESLEGKNLASLDQARQTAKKSHQKRIDDMLEAIYPLVQNYTEVLASVDPDAFINKHARACKPVKNETRVRLAFYCYLLFGRSRWALHYAVSNIGGWNRDEKVDGPKRGRASKTKGKESGHNIDSNLREKILHGYEKYKGLGKTMTGIYNKCMPKIFGCREERGENGFMKFVHPAGLPFPTLNQFDAHVAAAIGRDTVISNRLGPNRVRTKLAASLGMFTQAVANLMERVEADAYVVEEKPKGLIDGSTLKSLHVIRRRDVVSGLISGIGFSLGSERSTGYRMSAFCEAVDKVKFCSLFGIKISPEEWPSIGASPQAIADRGPGSTDGGQTSDVRYSPVIRGMPPSHAGQSKAVIESTNPNKIKNEEAPSHLKSEKNVFELIRREIRQVLIDNESIDITDRITPDLWEKVRKPCPNSLWTALDSLGRNDGVRMSFDDAVRSYLDCHDVTVKDGVFLHSQKYDSTALRMTKLLDKVAATQTLHMNAYVLEACVRHIWIEVDHQLIELDLQAGLRVGDDMLYMSLGQIKAREQEMRLTDSQFKEHRHAIAAEGHRKFEEETGLEWDGAARKVGRPKFGTKVARIETAESQAAMFVKKRA